MTIFSIIITKNWFILSTNKGLLKSWIFLLRLRTSIPVTSCREHSTSNNVALDNATSGNFASFDKSQDLAFDSFVFVLC